MALRRTGSQTRQDSGRDLLRRAILRRHDQIGDGTIQRLAHCEDGDDFLERHLHQEEEFDGLYCGYFPPGESRARLFIAVLSFALALPAADAMAMTRHRVHHTTYVRHHRHHYSETRGAAVGAVAGAVIDHKQPLKGALIGSLNQ